MDRPVTTLQGWVIDRYRLSERPKMGDVFIEDRGAGKWAVYNNSDVLNKHGNWEPEPMPSNRTNGFVERCRFDSPEEAALAFKECWE